MDDIETSQMHKYGESKTTRIMMATVRHVTYRSVLRRFQTKWFLLNRLYQNSPNLLPSTVSSHHW